MKPFKHVSLRWRLTLWSTLILAVVVAVFSGVAYFTVNQLSNVLFYPPIDNSLQQVAIANEMYMLRYRLPAPQFGRVDQPGSVYMSVYITVLDQNGRALSGNQFVPVDEDLLQKAIGGESNTGTVTLPDRSRVRVLYYPVSLLSQVTGESEAPIVLQITTSLSILDQLTNQMQSWLAIAAVVLLLVASTGSYLVTGRALRAVNNVTHKARQIETSQDLSRRIPEPGSDDEIGNLVKTFNQMLARLDTAFTAQRRFVADSSHELRTPLTVIKGNLYLLRRAADSVERTELIDTTEAEISRLNRMVNDLLYMAQMQAGHQLKPVLRAVELDSLLLDVFALARSMVALKEQRIVLVHEDVASTYGDRDQLQHLLLNLIDNAVKYTPQKGVITLGLWSHDNWARLEVSDTGVGIEPTDLPMLFERFFRSPEARHSGREGAGLGLAIVKSIADAHNGRVEVYSRLDEGTTFRVWLPSSETFAPEIYEQEEIEEIIEEKGRRLLPLPARAKLINKRIQEGPWANT